MTSLPVASAAIVGEADTSIAGPSAPVECRQVEPPEDYMASHELQGGRWIPKSISADSVLNLRCRPCQIATTKCDDREKMSTRCRRCILKDSICWYTLNAQHGNMGSDAAARRETAAAKREQTMKLNGTWGRTLRKNDGASAEVMRKRELGRLAAQRFRQRRLSSQGASVMTQTFIMDMGTFHAVTSQEHSTLHVHTEGQSGGIQETTEQRGDGTASGSQASSHVDVDPSPELLRKRQLARDAARKGCLRRKLAKEALPATVDVPMPSEPVTKTSPVSQSPRELSSAAIDWPSSEQQRDHSPLLRLDRSGRRSTQRFCVGDFSFTHATQADNGRWLPKGVPLEYVSKTCYSCNALEMCAFNNGASFEACPPCQKLQTEHPDHKCKHDADTRHGLLTGNQKTGHEAHGVQSLTAEEEADMMDKGYGQLLTSRWDETRQVQRPYTEAEAAALNLESLLTYPRDDAASMSRGGARDVQPSTYHVGAETPSDFGSWHSDFWSTCGEQQVSGADRVFTQVAQSTNHHEQYLPGDLYDQRAGRNGWRDPVNTDSYSDLTPHARALGPSASGGHDHRSSFRRGNEETRFDPEQGDPVDGAHRRHGGSYDTGASYISPTPANQTPEELTTTWNPAGTALVQRGSMSDFFSDPDQGGSVYAQQERDHLGDDWWNYYSQDG